MQQRITGVLTAIVTPFDTQGELSISALKQQVKRQIKYDNGIFCNGTNGEFFVLNTQEKLAVTQACIDEAAGKVPVVAHIGEISTAETIKLGKQVAALGANAVSVITPYFVPFKQEELIYHYQKIADALTVPVFMYNIPARTGNTIQPETAKILSSHPNIVGIKDSAGSYESLRSYLDVVSDIEGFDVLNGPDSLIHQGFVDGCSACISGLANVAPEAVSHIWKYYQSGDIDKSKRAQDIVSELRKELYAVAFSPAAVKKAVNLLGENVGESRYPIIFSDSDIQEIKRIIAKFSL